MSFKLQFPFFGPAVGMAGLVLALSGCAGLFGPPPTAEQIVRQRAEARWQALVAQDWETAYSFATPAYRSAIDLAGFRARHQGGAAKWKGVKPATADCKEASCDVNVTIVFEPTMQKGFGELSTTINEKWLLEDGQWWVHLKP